MKTHHPVESASYVVDQQDYKIITVLFVICSSLVLGLIPIVFGLGMSNPATDSQTQVVNEFSPWSVLGE